MVRLLATVAPINPLSGGRCCTCAARQAKPEVGMATQRGVHLHLDKPDISVLSDEFLAEVREMPQRNLAVELLQKLLSPVQSRLGPAASHSIPGLTASLQLTQRPRKLAPPRSRESPAAYPLAIPRIATPA